MNPPTTSLETSRRLKELGVKTESCFYWGHPEKSKEWILQFDDEDNPLCQDPQCKHGWIPAYLASELGEMLPKRQFGNHPLWYLTIHCNDDYYDVGYETFNGRIQKDFDCRDKNLAEALAKMLIYLLSNQLLNPKDLRK